MTHTEPARDRPPVVEALTQLIRFDTTNWGRGRSTGERAAAEWVVERLASCGWTPQLLTRDDAPKRANVVLRIPGMRPDLPALLAHGHLDVVPAAADDWTVDPFGGLVADGYVWGRGAADMKDMCAMTLTAVERWARTGVRPQRDIVVAFLADEEAGGRYGAQWLVRAHPELFAGVAAGISESGGMFRWLRHGDRSARAYPVGTAERGSMHLRLTARGAAGHASRPGRTTAVSLLIDALYRLAHHRWPMHLSPPVRAQLAGTAEALGLVVDLDSEAGVEACLEQLGHAADVARFTVRASSTPTMLDAGYKVNVIPGVATAEVDVRCPPGFAEELEATLPQLVGDQVELEFTSHSLPISAPMDGPWFEAIQDAVHRADPEAVVIPYCMGGGTDAKAFARLGIAGYGFAPLGEDPEGRTREGVHGVDERVPVASLLWGARVLDDFLLRV
ncbi:MAG TPA: M20/M25/M40 family metallo-hydrolase [Lapillicoccus sp.]|nr:M20/M25/M40 family metallo-hydrolase [Lapillicoccus sp.]